jgi:hypothetical protein
MKGAEQMKSSQVALIAVALALGAGAGYFFSPRRNVPVAHETQREDAVDVKKIDDGGMAASNAALRRRVEELESQLAEMEREKKSETAVAAAPSTPPPRESHSERMARMAKEDPARYTQMTNRFASWRRHRAEAARTRIDFLSSIDTSQMPSAAKKVHAQLQELVVEREELESALHQQGLSDEERGRLFGELRRTGAKMHELSMKERDNLLSETVRNLGFEGDDAGEIVTTVKEIFEATDSGPWHRPFGRGGPRGRR